MILIRKYFPRKKSNNVFFASYSNHMLYSYSVYFHWFKNKNSQKGVFQSFYWYRENEKNAYVSECWVWFGCVYMRILKFIWLFCFSLSLLRMFCLCVLRKVKKKTTTRVVCVKSECARVPLYTLHSNDVWFGKTVLFCLVLLLLVFEPVSFTLIPCDHEQQHASQNRLLFSSSTVSESILYVKHRRIRRRNVLLYFWRRRQQRPTLTSEYGDAFFLLRLNDFCFVTCFFFQNVYKFYPVLKISVQCKCVCKSKRAGRFHQQVSNSNYKKKKQCNPEKIVKQ